MTGEKQTEMVLLARMRVKRWLRSHGVKQIVLAEAIGEAQSWVSEFVNGKRIPSVAQLERIAAYFDQPFTALFDRIDDPDEQRLLDGFRAATKRGRGVLLETADLWSGRPVDTP